MVRNLEGQRFGHWLVVCRAENNKQGKRRWHCICDCGRRRSVDSYGLLHGGTKGCISCRRRDFWRNKPREKSLEDSPLYCVWEGIKQRCHNPNAHAYEIYGGRGIKVCERWQNSRNFIADMSPRPPGTELDRIDNDGSYSPENCRWATKKENNRNRRDNRMLTFRGETKPLVVWAEELGLTYGALSVRLSRLGWSVERALTTPVKQLRKRSQTVV